ncbi:uncharacterized protein LOC131447576 [Solea solea]|uniref:uncharacterized protein LOC131447576 n=1 Tax=Solea solea TaxID=90069 RepID=UPI00272A6352|nr:uncharacterized protein LOC131447576 [Solea solea]
MKTFEMLVLCVTLTFMLLGSVEGETNSTTPPNTTTHTTPITTAITTPTTPIPTTTTTAITPTATTPTPGSTAATTGNVTATTATTPYNRGCGVFGYYSQLLVPTIAVLVYSASG